jgi:hypothetical protein
MSSMSDLLSRVTGVSPPEGPRHTGKEITRTQLNKVSDTGADTDTDAGTVAGTAAVTVTGAVTGAVTGSVAGSVTVTGAATAGWGRTPRMPRFRFEHAKDVDTVFALITDPQALTKRCEALGERDVKVEVTETGSTKNVQIVREVEQELPGFAKKLFKPTNVLVEREDWRSEGDRKVAKGHLKIVGTGATFDSTITLSPSGSGSVYEIDFTVTAKAPLIRKKLEAFIGETALESLRKQHEHYAKALGG